jgi:hypothetical protein
MPTKPWMIPSLALLGVACSSSPPPAPAEPGPAASGSASAPAPECPKGEEWAGGKCRPERSIILEE